MIKVISAALFGIGTILIGAIMPHYYPLIEPYAGYILCFGLLLIGIALFLGVIECVKWHRQKELPHISTMDNCVQDESAGWFRDPTTDQIFCSKCWYDNEIVTPLRKDKSIVSGWICPKCGETYTSFARMLKYYLEHSRERRYISSHNLRKNLKNE